MISGIIIECSQAVGVRRCSQSDYYTSRFFFFQRITPKCRWGDGEEWKERISTGRIQ